MERIDSIDIFRGFAILQMIFWQIFDFFAKVDIYKDVPYYIPIFNMPIHGTGVAFFAFISGTSAYIALSRKLNKNAGKKDVIWHLIKRYGGYILLSLFFTTFVFGFKTFYIWNEAIQGIGLATLVAALVILLFRSKFVLAALSLAIILAQPFLRQFIENRLAIQNFPENLISFDIFSNAVSIFLNSAFRGFFSLSNLLPIALFGIVLSHFLLELNKKRVIKVSLALGIIFTLISIFLHFSINQIDYYNRSSSYQLFYIGLSFLLFGLIGFLLKKFKRNSIFDVLILFGKASIVAYLVHYIFIYKLLSILNYESVLDSLISYFLAVISIIAVYHICRIWLASKRTVSDRVKSFFGNY
ncbi:hypothetical protein HYW19_00420 [Candidatus Woesearchaeota archaeon]|nr:hypothetical protein [Candidatus Woesearchaeota archaeon]